MSNEPTRLSKSSWSCTTIVESVGSLPPPPQRSQVQGASHGKKRQAEESTFDSEPPSDISPPPLHRKRNKPIEINSGAESDYQPPPQKCRQTGASSSKSYCKNKHRSHHIPPPPTQAKATQRATATTSHHKAHINCPDNNFDQSSNDDNNVKPRRAQDLPPPRRRKDAHSKRRHIEEQTPPQPKRKSRTVSRIQEEDVFLSDSEDIPSTLYGGLQDEDDTAKENAAIASPVHPRVAARKNKASLKVKSELTAAPQNKNLPRGALEHNRWSGVFLPTFLKYVGMQEDIWTLSERETMVALQIIWNRVYSSEDPVGSAPVVHVVGLQVYSVVVQRVTEWRSSIGSTALAVVNDFLDSQKLYTTEEHQWVVADLLYYQRYVYYNTRDVEENGVRKARTNSFVLRNGRYRGPLVIYTIAQHLIDTENAINIPELIEGGTFPKAAIALSAVAVHRALELWEKGYITYESYYEAKTKGWKTGGIIKVTRPDGKLTKTTNFGRKQCEQWSDQHCRDVWQVDDGKMQVIMADARKAVDVILSRNGTSKRASHAEGKASGPSREVIGVESDPEFWSATPAVFK